MTEKNHWQLIPAQEYQCPTPPTVMRLKQQWRRLLRTLGVVKSADLAVNEDQSEPDPPDFTASAAQAALAGYLSEVDCAQQGVCFLLDPPFSGTAAMARTWGWQQGRALLTPPTHEQIVQVAVDDWWQQQAMVKGLVHTQAWLIDDLARYFLRTAVGLRFIRAWLPRVLAGEFGVGLIVCDSWAFAFLSRDWPHNLPSSHSLAPATPDLLRQLGIEGKDHQLERLTGEARGNLGLAWALWRRKYVDQQSLPVLPVTANDTTGFILYALLLHRGLSLTQLAEVLSNVALDELKMQLLSLNQRGIIYADEESGVQSDVKRNAVRESVAEADSNETPWRITALAYLTVREFLGGRDYLLDNF